MKGYLFTPDVACSKFAFFVNDYKERDGVEAVISLDSTWSLAVFRES